MADHKGVQQGVERLQKKGDSKEIYQPRGKKTGGGKKMRSSFESLEGGEGAKKGLPPNTIII